MARSKTIRNVYDKKFKTFPFEGIWLDVMDTPERTGIWLVYGVDKNGKTWFSLKLADYLSTFDKVLYVSAEEGISMSVQETLKRLNINPSNRRLQFEEYIPLDDLAVRLSKRKAPKIVFLDNLTIYADELRGGKLMKLVSDNPDKLFVLIAHEDRNEPYTAVAKLARKLAKVIVRVKGLACMISGRCPGGVLTIDEEKATLFWGQQIITKNKKDDETGE